MISLGEVEAARELGKPAAAVQPFGGEPQLDWSCSQHGLTFESGVNGTGQLMRVDPEAWKEAR